MKRLILAGYLMVLRTYFRHLKIPFSWLVDRFRPRSICQLPIHGSLEEYALWADDHLRWKLDPLWGLVDLYPSLEHVCWQIEHKGVAEDDCDGLAYFTAAAVSHLADNSRDVYIVTLVLDPFVVPLVEAAHVINILRAGNRWRVFSNARLYPRRYASFDEALGENPYCRGKEINYVEIRDARLERVTPPVG